MAKGITVRIPVDTWAELKEMSKQNCRTIGQTIAWIVKNFKHQETFEEYYQRNKPYIDHSLAQPGKHLSIEEVFDG